ncbi:RIP metalloprotease RseP [candidate division KSB1 bacterium]|nr:RIP metalloprotease RseP [candidate division KSB1 bacterium]
MTITTIVSFIFVLGILVFIHELGHFLAAKWAGIRVERFSLGFPPRMFGKKIGDTDYCISWIPLGGYVKMAGMIDESFDEKIEGKPDEFMSKPIWKRAIVIGAGPFMNILLAFALFVGLIYKDGIPEASPEAVVGSVMEKSPAEGIGLQPGDRILSVADQPITSWEALTKVIHGLPDSTIAIVWERAGTRMDKLVKPMLDPARKIGLIGIGPQTVMREVGLGQAMAASATYSILLTREVGKTIGRLISGQGSVREDLAGPIRIMKFAGEFARQGFMKLLEFMALISLQLGLLNILPIPVLDGGHLVFLGLEAIMRRPVSLKVRVLVHQIGMALLLALMAFILINDVRSL